TPEQSTLTAWFWTRCREENMKRFCLIAVVCFFALAGAAQITVGPPSGKGTGTGFCTVAGALTSGHLVAFDANGNCIDGGAPYSLPTATSSTLGGVKPDGTSILNTAGAIS